ncbi:type II secretion system protein GspD [Solemya velum gill symbiont]|uniref:Type II secretion system protein GspD n=1 Tax=Solemya velum gill symbiont TaxID=2340 RepID=A0A1T2DYB8_SOVGS|nr:type II secretion system secretin GspD [Solemya velum gill symbiont]OOY35688.1 type II secretion system protein GspD [Solemya velum gill symbiont]OOY38316.1 type II secretion system protein GspD [Solemya velum gill symbiont]OOY40767.1 type II secretion system protein GspD [Solemya velum gill symbiont]OOY44445.1 type II secretion system protein GspD [Solemya velum gill symbiont]OOY52100.1 type II secretion system protein GspD [Solemya velum gill symbiont]
MDDGNLVRILPASSSREQAPINLSGSATDDDSIEVQVIPVEHVPSVQMVPILRPLVEKDGHLAAHANSNSLIVAASRRTIAKIRQMLETLDQEAESELETIPLKHASATDIVTTLQTLAGSGGAGGPGNPNTGTGTKLVAEERTNSVLVSGNVGFRERIKRIISQLDTPVKDNRNIHVVALHFAKAEDLAPIIEKLATVRAPVSPAAGSPGAQEQVPSVQADVETNSLIITARPGRMKELRSVIRRLDVRRSQVLVEALIAEVSLTKEAELGIQWLGASDELLESTSGDDDTSAGEAIASLLGTSAVSQGTLVGLLHGGGMSFAAIGRALDNDSDSNILSTPSILTLDNHEAEITVGQEVPFTTGSYTTTTGDATNPFQTITREDVGLTLKITPQISKGKAVVLDIDQEISSVVPGSAASDNPITSKRTIKTKVVVDDESILVLGGLIDDRISEAETRVPLLGDIPVLGELFTHRKNTSEKRNLMIFIRPSILRDSYKNLNATRKRHKEVRDMQLVKQQAGITLLPEAEHPVLKQLDARGREIEPQPVKQKKSTDDTNGLWKH